MIFSFRSKQTTYQHPSCPHIRRTGRTRSSEELRVEVPWALVQIFAVTKMAPVTTTQVGTLQSFNIK